MEPGSEYIEPKDFTGKLLEVVWSLVLMGAGFGVAWTVTVAVKAGWRLLVK